MKVEYLMINFRDELLRIDLSRIVFMEADGNYTNIISANNMKSVVCMTLSKMQELLSETLKERASVFARVGKRHIINLGYVHTINTLKQKLVLSDDHSFMYQINVSKEALKALKLAMVKISNKK